MDAFFAAVGRVSWFLAVLVKLILAAIVVEVISDVVLRNLNLRPLSWGVSATEYGLLYSAFLPMPWLVRTKGHVFVEFLRKSLPTRGQVILERIVYCVCIALCLYLFYYAAGELAVAWRTGAYEMRTFDMPKWLIDLPVCIGFLLSALEWLRYLLCDDSLYHYNVLEQEGL
jgi:TRAP-type C4-dicarboxylate transport system permease small subunit